MAKTKHALFSLAASGSLAGQLLFANQRGKQIARSMRGLRSAAVQRRTTPPSAAQMARRATYAAACAAWQALTTNQREAYRAAADAARITPFNLYLKTALRQTGTAWDGGSSTWDNGASVWS